MAEVKWIKLSTNMFQDEKIKLIEALPEADTILIIWVKLLVQAGKTNASGYIYLNENIPFSDEMLATIFNRPIATVRLALRTFEQFEMIEISDNQMINISNWGKHQNVDGLEKIREQNRLRKQRERDSKRINSPQIKEIKVSRDITGHVTENHATEIDKDIDKEKALIHYVEILDYLNEKAGTRFKSKTEKTKRLIKARCNEGFTKDDFLQVIDIKTAEWLKDSNMSKYLRPETLFGPKFESYLNQKQRGITDGTNANAKNMAAEYGLQF